MLEKESVKYKLKISVSDFGDGSLGELVFHTSFALAVSLQMY